MPVIQVIQAMMTAAQLLETCDNTSACSVDIVDKVSRGTDHPDDEPGCGTVSISAVFVVLEQFKKCE